jgi:Fur family ferric uptake transcriptional regulator
MVLDAVLSFDEHFEAEQVLHALRQRGCSTGKATVYRTLPLLVECGVLQQVRFDAKQAYYEYAYGVFPHDHMVCRRCGRIVEFDVGELIALRDRIAGRERFHVIGHRFQISGLCWACSTSCPVAAVVPNPRRLASPRRAARRGTRTSRRGAEAAR